MRKKLKYFAITFVFALSFIYTEKISNIVKNKDPIMIDIINIKDDYKVESVNAIIENNTIKPGKNGCEIDTNKSYHTMKNNNKFDYNLLKYKDIVPNISVNNYYDKYIVSGNNFDKNVSFVIYLKNMNNLDKVNKINDIKLNIFLDSELLKDKKIDITDNKKIYNGGTDLIYNDVVIEWVNEVINSNYNKSNYCLNLDMNDEYLKKCSKKKMYSISPKSITNVYNAKKNIENGSIIYIDENNLDKIDILKNYIIKKGFNIVYLDELLSEKRCDNT